MNCADATVEAPGTSTSTEKKKRHAPPKVGQGKKRVDSADKQRGEGEHSNANEVCLVEQLVLNGTMCNRPMGRGGATECRFLCLTVWHCVGSQGAASTSLMTARPMRAVRNAAVSLCENSSSGGATDDSGSGELMMHC